MGIRTIRLTEAQKSWDNPTDFQKLIALFKSDPFLIRQIENPSELLVHHYLGENGNHCIINLSFLPKDRLKSLVITKGLFHHIKSLFIDDFDQDDFILMHKLGYIEAICYFVKKDQPMDKFYDYFYQELDKDPNYRRFCDINFLRLLCREFENIIVNFSSLNYASFYEDVYGYGEKFLIPDIFRFDDDKNGMLAIMLKHYFPAIQTEFIRSHTNKMSMEAKQIMDSLFKEMILVNYQELLPSMRRNFIRTALLKNEKKYDISFNIEV